MTAQQVKDKLAKKNFHLSSLSKRNGIFTARRAFFYTHGNTSQKMADAIQKALPDAQILDHAEVWKDFKGGEPVHRQSHWWVKFKLPA